MDSYGFGCKYRFYNYCSNKLGLTKSCPAGQAAQLQEQNYCILAYEPYGVITETVGRWFVYFYPFLLACYCFQVQQVLNLQLLRHCRYPSAPAAGLYGFCTGGSEI